MNKAEVKHTPGPWSLDEEACNVVHEPSGSVIARFFTPDDFPCLESGTPEMGCAEQELPANAALIAAAPDLLAALELILPMAKGYAAEHPVGNNALFIVQAEEALSKSTARAKEGM